MTACADDLALGDLLGQTFARCEERTRPGQPERLRRRVAVIEVHLVRQVNSTAVLARHLPKLAQKLERRALPRHHPIDFALAISPVELTL